MTNKRITELTALDGDDVANDDLLVIVDVSDTTMAASGTNKKITVAEFATDSTLGGAFVAKSTLTTDGDMLTRASGVPDRITRADLAQDSAFSSRYKPLASDVLWVSAGAMSVLEGSPSLGTLGAATFTYQRTGVWLMDASAIEIVDASVIIPPGWASANVYLWWSNAGAGSGDVRWSVFRNTHADGVTTDASTLLSATNVTAPAQYVAKRTQVGTSVTEMSANTVHRIAIVRSATNAGDTLANDAGIIGLEIVRAS